MLLGILYLAIIAPYFVLSLGAIIAIFSGIIFNGEKIVGTNNLLLSSSSTLSLYHLHLIFIGILLTFSPMHFLGFNVMPRRIPSFPDTFHSWNLLSSKMKEIPRSRSQLSFLFSYRITFLSSYYWSSSSKSSLLELQFFYLKTTYVSCNSKKCKVKAIPRVKSSIKKHSIFHGQLSLLFLIEIKIG